MEGGLGDMSRVSELVEGARRVVPASPSPSADAQQQEGMTVVPALFPVLPAPGGGNASSPRRGGVGGVWRSRVGQRSPP